MKKRNIYIFKCCYIKIKNAKHNTLVLIFFFRSRKEMLKKKKDWLVVGVKADHLTKDLGL